MNSRIILSKNQGFVVIMLTVAALVVVTALSMIFLQQVLGIFYASTIDAILITSIIVCSSKVIHDKLVKYS